MTTSIETVNLEAVTVASGPPPATPERPQVIAAEELLLPPLDLEVAVDMVKDEITQWEDDLDAAILEMKRLRDEESDHNARDDLEELISELVEMRERVGSAAGWSVDDLI